MEKNEKSRKSVFDIVTTCIIIAICLVVAFFLIKTLLDRDDSGLAINQTTSSSSTVNVSVEAATYGDLTAYTTIYGNIVTDSNPVVIYPDVAGEITEILVKKGDRVEAGQVVGYVDQSRPGYSYTPSAITTPVAGEVTVVSVTGGDTVSTSSPIITVRLDEELKISTNVPERYISVLTPGTVSTFAVTAYPERTYEAELTYTSPTVDTSNRTTEIELTIIGDESGLMEGMFATINLATASAENVITVPTSAISSDGEGNYVLLAIGGSATRSGVVTGLSDGTRTVILSGLNEGDLVITSGSASVGSAVSIVEGN